MVGFVEETVLANEQVIDGRQRSNALEENYINGFLTYQNFPMNYLKILEEEWPEKLS